MSDFRARLQRAELDTPGAARFAFAPGYLPAAPSGRSFDLDLGNTPSRPFLLHLTINAIRINHEKKL